MPIDNDTICAISTPWGVGGIAVARISGGRAIEISDKIWQGARLSDCQSHTARLGAIVDEHSQVLDQAVATVFRAPKSFTGEDVVEFSMHGSLWIQREVINLLIRQGCRLAKAGEFTRRAFANGKMDLAQAEGVADLIASSSRSAHRIAISQMRGGFSQKLASLREELLELSSLLELELDFSEEDVEFASRQKLLAIAQEVSTAVNSLASTFAAGSAIIVGVPVARAGGPYAGKSTLLNRLLHEERAIVSEIPGTTRDAIEDTVEIEGTLFRFIDTAGLRATSDEIEALGIGRTIERMRNSLVVMWVIDGTASPESFSEMSKEILQHLSSEQAIMAVVNKTDLIDEAKVGEIKEALAGILPNGSEIVAISALGGEGMPELQNRLLAASGCSSSALGDVMVTNARHYEALTLAGESIARAIEGIKGGISGDFIAQDVRETLYYLGEITGKITSAEILESIFSRFCIGK